MEFQKWPSIENTYREKNIAYFRALFPDIDDMAYVITEKLHGANFSVYFSTDGTWKIAKRKSFIKDDEAFFGVHALIADKYTHVFDEFAEVARVAETEYIIYGELFGGNIQKGVDYGDEKHILFFGMRVDGDFVPFVNFLKLTSGTFIGAHIVPTFGIAYSLADALAFDTNILSKVGTTICEGAVIQPLNYALCDKNGSYFLLKKKNEAFLEAHKAAKPPKPLDTEVARLQNEVTGYVTKMRLQGIFSKEGEIEEPKQIGQYIKLMVADITEDFCKDFPEFEDCTKSQKGQIMKVVGKLTANLLQENYL